MSDLIERVAKVHCQSNNTWIGCVVAVDGYRFVLISQYLSIYEDVSPMNSNYLVVLWLASGRWM